MRCILISIILLLSNSACAPTVVKPPEPPPPPSDNINVTLIQCVHKHDSDITVKYYSNNITRFTTNNVITYYIKDIYGKDIFLNIYEIENYNCNGELDNGNDD